MHLLSQSQNSCILLKLEEKPEESLTCGFVRELDSTPAASTIVFLANEIKIIC